MEFFTPGHLIILAIVAAVLFFGWKQLPDMARSLGRSLRIFKTEIKGMSEDDKARETAKLEPPAIDAPAPRIDTPRTETRTTAPTSAPAAKPRPRPVPGQADRTVGARSDTPGAGGQ
jgi:sec-independent protein translocase protein TatA